MKLYHRLLDALEDEVLTYIETQQVARNGCEVLRLLKSMCALKTQYIETDLIFFGEKKSSRHSRQCALPRVVIKQPSQGGCLPASAAPCLTLF